MSESNVHVVTDLPAKKPFYLNKKYVAVVAVTAAATAAYVIKRKSGFTAQEIADTVVETATPN